MVLLMIRFGTVGTSWITEAFLRTLARFPEVCLSGVCSRDPQKARAFAEKHGAAYACSDLEQLAKVSDAVYLASPNALHFRQTLFFLERNIPVLCEKPIASNAQQAQIMYRVAKERKVLLMEAYKSAFLPGLEQIRRLLPRIGPVRNVFGTFSKYSSRYDAHKRGESVNTFQAEFSNGAMMDLGIYCIYPVLMLFGPPSQVTGSAILIPGGVDGAGTVILRYPDFIATLNCSKISDTDLSCEIQGEEGTISADCWNLPSRIALRLRNGGEEVFSFPKEADGMDGEIGEFLTCLRNRYTESRINTPALSVEVLRIVDLYRGQCGVIYPADG